jgi:hypothetical protein
MKCIISRYLYSIKKRFVQGLLNLVKNKLFCSFLEVVRYLFRISQCHFDFLKHRVERVSSFPLVSTVADKIVWTPCVTMFEQAFLLYFNGSA